jgi:hypothetical protein
MHGSIICSGIAGMLAATNGDILAPDMGDLPALTNGDNLGATKGDIVGDTIAGLWNEDQGEFLALAYPPFAVAGAGPGASPGGVVLSLSMALHNGDGCGSSSSPSFSFSPFRANSPPGGAAAEPSASIVPDDMELGHCHS